MQYIRHLFLRHCKPNMEVQLKLLLVACFTIQVIQADPTRNDVRDKARSYIGSTRWAKASSSGTGPNTWKCNQFVSHVFNQVGLSVPQRRPVPRWIRDMPIGAQEWANPNSPRLRSANCWISCSSPSIGDVIAYRGHVGIVTGYRTTTSAAEYSVVENDWGFRSGQQPTCWRYNYTNFWC